MDNSEYRKILQRYRNMGISLWVEGDDLKFTSINELSEEQMSFLKSHKMGLLNVLRKEVKSKEFPLTDIQSSYLLGRMESFDYGGLSCQIYMEMEYQNLDAMKVQNVWNILVQRHEMLRAVIHNDGYQVIRNEVPELKVKYYDLTKNASAIDELTSIRNERENKTFQIGEWPFFDVAVSQLPNTAVIHLTIDFLIADWMSIWLLLNEFELLYNGTAKELPTIELTFEEYLNIESEMKNTVKYRTDKRYWFDRIDQFAECPDIPVLEKDKVQNKFERYFAQFSLEEWDSLKTKAAVSGCTPTAVIMSAYAKVLELWSADSMFALNLTLLNRLPLHDDVNKIIGDFTSVNLLEIDLSEENAFIDDVRRIQKQMFQDLDHRSYSGVQVLREIIRRKGNEKGLYPYVFTSSLGLVEETSIEGKIGDYGISKTPQVFIDCQAMDNKHGLRINWDVRAGIFPEHLVEDMFSTFIQVLRKLIKREDAWKSKRLVTIPERQQLVRTRVNQTKQIQPYKSLHGGILERISEYKDKVCIIDGKGTTTYGDLKHRAENIAAKLLSRGCQPGDRVGIMIPKSSEQIEAVLGSLMIGAVYVPIDDSQPISRINKMLSSADARYVLKFSEFKEVVEVGNAIDIDEVCHNIDSVHAFDSKEDDLAYIIFTSGSTGMPKGVQITHGAAVNTINDIINRFSISEKDSILALSKLNFDLSVFDIFGMLSVGGTIVLPKMESYLDAGHWYDLMKKNHITVWNTVPALMQILLEYLDRKSVESIDIRLALLSGDWVPVTMPKTIWNYAEDAEVVALGGATEASIWSNYYICGKDDIYKESIPYGYPLSNQSYQILDKGARDCPDWVAGELCIGGKGLALGYVNAEKDTESQFTRDRVGERLYRTGDYGYYTTAGEIIFLGRRDNQIKLRGHRIELGEIESVLRSHPAITNIHIMLCGESSKNIFATICCKEDILISEIGAFIGQRLPEHMVPGAIKIVDELPLTSNGKVDTETIKGFYEEWQTTNNSELKTSSSNELEKKMLEMLESYLGITNILAESNVYELGADSLVLAQFIGQLKEYLEVIYPNTTFSFDSLLRQILNTPTIRELSVFVSECVSNSVFDVETNIFDKEDTQIGSLIEYGGGDGELTRIVFHAVLGTTNDLRKLMNHMVEQNLGPVIGISVKDSERYCSIDEKNLLEEVAQDYCDQIIDRGYRNVQLIGYSLGGLIALESARQLSEKGVNVVDLTLIDSMPVNYHFNTEVVLELIFITNLGITVEDLYNNVNNQDFKDFIALAYNEEKRTIDEEGILGVVDDRYAEVRSALSELISMSTEARFSSYSKVIKRVRNEEIRIEMLLDYYRIYKHNVNGSNITPMVYFGDIRLLHPIEPMEFVFLDTEGAEIIWDDICIGNLDVVEISGNHLSCIQNDKYVKELAEVIKKPIVDYLT